MKDHIIKAFFKRSFNSHKDICLVFNNKIL